MYYNKCILESTDSMKTTWEIINAEEKVNLKIIQIFFKY
jgi:hypothetical protein